MLNKKINTYLSFTIGKENFAINVANVISIVEVPEITRLPKTPEFVKGLINTRGQGVPLIDPSIKFGLDPIQINANTTVIILEISVDDQLVQVGILVDAVNDVKEISQDEILPLPKVANIGTDGFLTGLYATGNEFIIIMDANFVISSDEMSDLSKTLHSIKQKTEK
ncbi:MAG: chemotaxis protein CheW [Thiohalospira sp.]